MALGARQIYDVQFTDLDLDFAVCVHFGAFNSDCEHRVAAGRVLVHVRLAHMPVEVSFLKDLHHIIWVLDDKRGEILDVDTGVLVVQLESLADALLVQQVLDLFVVNLQVRRAHQVLPLRVAADRAEHVLECARHDSHL